MKENNFKRAVREDRVVLGTTLGSFAERDTPKLLEYGGFDWVMVDMEHGGWTLDVVADLVAWFDATPITVVVRPPENSPSFLRGIMNVGAMGVQVGHVTSGEEARSIVDAVMYPPLGRRSATGGNASNERTTVIADVESREGVERIDEILAVDGVDIVHFGQNDLSHSLGVPGDYDHPVYKAALETVAAACKRHGKTFKCNPHHEVSQAEAYRLGCRIMGMGRTAVIFQDAMKRATLEARAQLAKLGAS